MQLSEKNLPFTGDVAVLNWLDCML